MNWFTPKLEPGERVVLRSPSRWYRWILPVGWASFPLFIWLGTYLASDGPWPEDPQDWLLLKTYAVMGAVFGGLHFIKERWRFMVTDRRLIIRRGWLRHKIEIVPLDRIDRLRHSESIAGFDFLCGDEVIAVESDLLSYSRLHKALGLPDERGKIYETDIRKMLELGERVVARQGKSLGTELWAVTNRRFLYLPGGYTEVMNLEDIQEVVKEPYVPKVILRGDGREITIRCFEDEAKTILTALGREPVEAWA